MKYHVYILRNHKNHLYIGSTNNLEERLKRHKKSQAARFTSQNRGFKLVYKEEVNTLQEAMRREKQIKSWTRAKKEALINGNTDLLKKLSKKTSVRNKV